MQPMLNLTVDWRYQLTLKGLLFYLISTICHNETTKEERKKLAQHKIVKTKTINEVIKITSEISNKKQDLRFLNCFQVFDEIYDTKTKVDIILQIARELENLVSERTSEFLRDYVITRCYDEVTIKIADIQKSEMIHNLRHKCADDLVVQRVKKWKSLKLKRKEQIIELDRLEQYKEKILYKLIPITKSRLENMMEDLKTTKQGKRKGSKSKQNLNLNPV